MKEPGRHEHKKMGMMDRILIFVAIFIVLFTITMIWLYKTTLGIPDTLVTYVFLTITGEFGVMGLIKSTKERNQARRWQIEDELRQRQYMKEDIENERRSGY